MTILSFPFRALSFTTILCAAPLMLAGTAQANIAVPLPQISSQQISKDIERRQNPATGAVEYYAPSFDPFEAIDNIAGTVSLRSNTRVTATDGHILRGGAILDVNFFYTTESNDPYDLAGFETAVFLSGEAVRSTFYDNRIVECSEKIREVVYDKQYYNGASFGLLAGIYRPFPRYRGHRNFGHRGFGYDWRYPRGFSGTRGFSRRNGFNRRSRFGNNRGELRRDRRERDARDGRRRDRRERDNERHYDRDDRHTHGLRPGDRRGQREDGRRRDRDYRRVRDDDSRRGRRNDERRGGGRNNRSESFAENPDKSNYSPRRGLRTVKGQGRSGQERRNNRRNDGANSPIKSRPIKSRPQTGQTIKRPQPSGSQRSQPARTQRSQPARAERSQPKQSRPVRSQSKRSQKSERRSSPPKRSQPKRSISKATNRSFKRNRAQIKSGHKLNFFPQAGYRSTTVSVSQRCAREENLSVYIPRDRLDAARYDGLTLLVLDRDGKDIPIYIPPNYIEGFRNTAFGAAGAPQSSQYSSGGYVNPDARASEVPSYGSGFGPDDEIDYANGAVLDEGVSAPSPDGREPRIYGDPNGVGTYRQWPEETE